MEQKMNDLQKELNDLEKELNKYQKKSGTWSIITIASALALLGARPETSPSIEDAIATLLCCLMTVGTVKFIELINERDNISNKILDIKRSNIYKRIKNV